MTLPWWFKTKSPRELIGKPLRDTGLRNKYGVTIVAIKPEAHGSNASVTYATPDTTLMYGDLILVVGAINAVERFAATD